MYVSEKNKKAIVYIFFYILVVYIMFCVPLTHDDLGMHKVKIDFENIFLIGNGRLVGNVIGIIFSKYEFIRMIGKAFCLTALVVLLQKMLKNNSCKELLVCMLLVLCPAKTIFAESYSWTAGFGNYVPVIVIELLIICMVFATYKSKYIQGIACGAILILSILDNLFIEHCTLVNIILCWGFLLFCIFHKKKVRLTLIFACVGTAIGSASMFLVPRLLKVSYKMEQYRHVNLGLDMIKTVISNVFTISRYMSGSIVLLVILSVALLYIRRKTDDRTQYEHWMDIGLLALPIYGLVLGNITNESGWSLKHTYVFHIICVLLFAVYIFGVATTIITKTCTYKYHMVLSFGMGIFVFLILCMVSPIGGRTLYLPYICWTITALYAIKESDILKIKNKILDYMVCIVSVCIAYMMIWRFQCIHHIDMVRTEYLQEQINNGETNIVLPTANVGGYVYCDTVDVDPDQINITMVTWESWISMITDR